MAPTQWLAQLIKGHYKRFSIALVQKETPKRVQALTKMRKEMQKRFLLLYRHFRLKKYGEAIPDNMSEITDEDQLEDIFKEDLALQ